MHRRPGTAGATAFVREVLLPGGPDAIPRIDPDACAFPLRHGPSHIHRWGLFAAGPIPARRRVIDYRGQRIDGAEAYRRRLRPHTFIYRTGPDRCIDGAVGGSGAEFVNHGCDPNLVARLRRGRISFVSLRPIQPSDELLVDYRLAGTGPPIRCLCGSSRCRGLLFGT